MKYIDVYSVTKRKYLENNRIYIDGSLQSEKKKRYVDSAQYKGIYRHDKYDTVNHVIWMNAETDILVWRNKETDTNR